MGCWKSIVYQCFKDWCATLRPFRILRPTTQQLWNDANRMTFSFMAINWFSSNVSNLDQNSIVLFFLFLCGWILFWTRDLGIQISSMRLSSRRTDSCSYSLRYQYGFYFVVAVELAISQLWYFLFVKNSERKIIECQTFSQN